jgi:NAD(P)H-dependent flavin oxidoreductase YrpB (nitropropane dioxygenase family)
MPSIAAQLSRAASRSTRPQATSQKGHVDVFKAAGVKVIYKCTAVRHALICGREFLMIADTDHGVWSAGMAQGLIHDIPTVKQLIDRIVDKAETLNSA